MLRNYFRIAFRNLLRYKTYASINVLGLAIGMACCILILLIVHYEFSYNKHHKNADHIYALVRETKIQDNKTQFSMGTMGPVGPALKSDFPEIQETARLFSTGVYVEYNNKVIHQIQCMTDASILDVFTFPLIAGDPKQAFAQPYSILITQEMAEKLFESENPIGKMITIDNKYMGGDYTVTGILRNIPESSTYPLRFDCLSATVTPHPHLKLVWETWHDRQYRPVYTFLQLSKEASPNELEQKLSAFVERRLDKGTGAKTVYHLQSLSDIHLSARSKYGISHYGDIHHVYFLSAIALSILLVACVNFVNLSLALSTSRSKEIGIRKVVGAQKRQLVFQFLGESVFLSLVAFLLALMIAELFLPAIKNFLMVVLVVV